MKAIVFERYGSTDVLELRDIDTPVVADDGVEVTPEGRLSSPSDAEEERWPGSR